MNKYEIKIKNFNILLLYLLPPTIFSNLLMNLIITFIAVSYLILFYKNYLKMIIGYIFLSFFISIH